MTFTYNVKLPFILSNQLNSNDSQIITQFVIATTFFWYFGPSLDDDPKHSLFAINVNIENDVWSHEKNMILPVLWFIIKSQYTLLHFQLQSYLFERAKCKPFQWEHEYTYEIFMRRNSWESSPPHMTSTPFLFSWLWKYQIKKNDCNNSLNASGSI